MEYLDTERIAREAKTRQELEDLKKDPSYEPRVVLDAAGRVVKRAKRSPHPAMASYLKSMIGGHSSGDVYTLKGTMSPFNKRGKLIRPSKTYMKTDTKGKKRHLPTVVKDQMHKYKVVLRLPKVKSTVIPG